MDCTPCDYDQWSPDADGDGLPDGAESGPADLDCDQDKEIDLSAMGADPNHKDLFVEIDSMEGLSLSNEAVNTMVAAFANAPVSNPDGEPGITMHVDNGPDSIMNPETGEKWGSTEATASGSRHDIAYDEVLGAEDNDDYVWAEFDSIKEIDPERQRAFRYVISADNYGSATNTSSGLARGIPGSDMIVSLGFADNARHQAGTLMHELGHLLGLKHGGVDHINQKPNYLSIMNYRFQLGWLRRASGVPGPTLDYSRFDSADMGELNENVLDENDGFGVVDPQVLTYRTSYECPPGGTFIRLPVGMAGSIDWDCDGTDEDSVAANINGDKGGFFDSDLFNVLAPQDDWSNLKFTGGGVGSFGGAADLPDPPEETEMIEPSKELLEVYEQLNQQPIVDGEPPTGGGGGGGTSGGTGGGGLNTSATPGPTGQQAAALAKCKKKKTAKAKRNCRKKAKKLPL
jgi:hypothetical protein